MVANWIPLADPAGGPNFYPLDEDARYYVKIDNTGDGYEDVAYRWDFDTKFRNANSFLYAVPPVTSVNDRNLNLVQTYDLYKEEYNKDRKMVSTRRVVDDAPVVPDNVGPKTMPNFAQIEAGGITPLKGGGKTIVTPADDAFFVDLGAIFDGINIDKPGRPNIGLGNQGGGKDDVAGYNTKSFVLQVPEREVTRDGKQVSGASDGDAVVGVWSTTERRSDQVLGGSRAGVTVHKWVQVSRLGNPLINEVIVPLGKKDKFNRTSPADDARNFGPLRAQPRARAAPERAVRSRRPGDEPDRHRPGAADRRARADADRQEPGRGRHAQAQPGCRRRRTRTASASSRATWQGSRTAAGWRTTWSTSSSA